MQPLLSCSAPHDSATWPPRFHKLLLRLGPRPGEPAGYTCELAYCDARRFGRVKLCEGDPADSDIIKKLGFDPLLEMPDLQGFKVGTQAGYIGRKGQHTHASHPMQWTGSL